MLIETIISVNLIEGYRFVKSIKMTEKALNNYTKAYEKSELAQLLVSNKIDDTENVINNFINKKKAVRQYTLPRFIDVYSTIKKFSRDRSEEIAMKLFLKVNDLSKLDNLKDSLKIELSDKELLTGVMFRGLGYVSLKDSERLLSASSNQLSYSHVQYSQAESIIEVLDSIIKRIERVSKILIGFNYLLTTILYDTEEIIKKNGSQAENYSYKELELLATCENLAFGIIEVLEIPIVDENNVITKEAEKLILSAENYLEKIKQYMEVYK